MVGGKMPGGFDVMSIKAHLSKTWELGPSCSDGVLLLGTTIEPAKRLGSEVEAKAWLDIVVAPYAQRSRICLLAGRSGSGGSGGAQGATINSEEFLKFQAEQGQFAAQHVGLYIRYLKRDSCLGGIAFDKGKANSAELQTKLVLQRNMGTPTSRGFSPSNHSLKARRFDSSWNWVHQDALVMYYDIIFGRLATVDREITGRCIALLNRVDPD
jgi:fatty acid synthase subunit beta